MKTKISVKYIGKCNVRFTKNNIYHLSGEHNVGELLAYTVIGDDGLPHLVDASKFEIIKTDNVDTTWFISYSHSTSSRSGFGNLSVKVKLGEGQTTLTFKTIQDLEARISKECYNGVGKVVITNFIRIEGN